MKPLAFAVVALAIYTGGCALEVDTAPATSWSADDDARDEAQAAVDEACKAFGECLVEAPRGTEHGVHFQRGATRHAGAEAQWEVATRTVTLKPVSTGPVARQAVLHELGHALGMPHDETVYVAVMQPGVDAANPQYAVTGYTCQDRMVFASLRSRDACV